jgi:polyketide synthase 5
LSAFKTVPERSLNRESAGLLLADDKKATTPIAIIGMACRLPGDIGSPDLLWEALLRGDDLVTEIPPDRWDADEYYDPEPGVPGRSVSRWGAFIDDVGGFDSDFFGINDREATAIDPQHRLLLETSWEAMEHAGVTPAGIANSLTGVFVGLTHGDYQLLAADAHSVEGPYGFTGTTFSLASGRIAYALGVHGPAMTLDSACSSGLLAVHMACRNLHDGESDLALAGGASVILDPRKFSSGSAQGMLSPTGRCHAFDTAADGFVASEGCAVVLLKRLADAQRDGDRILAVIRGSAANQDGRTVNIATPSATAQTVVYRNALAAAGVDPRTVGMVEAHGPGTPVGDPIEYASLANVYGTEGPCALASVKTNFGHAQAASGTLSLVKTVLALQHGVVPPNLHFDRLPDELNRIDTQMFVPQTTTPWSTNGHHARRAAVSSYGLSGTNVHVILEEAPQQALPDTGNGSAFTAPLLFALSSTSEQELRRTAGRLADWATAHADDVALPDLAYTLARRRGHRPVRAAVIAATTDELVQSLRELADGETPHPPAVGQDDRGPVWVFSGQGSQWAAMGAQLLATEPVFATTVAEMEPLIASEAGFSVTEAMSASETLTGIDRVQPTLFAVQVALAATMKAHGVLPGAVVGHSLGESAAAVVAGALSLEDGARVICRRSRLMSTIAGSGAMASVELPAQQVLSELMARGVNDVVVAVVASPQSTVIGGAAETVRELVAAWEERDVMSREVAVDVASHSPQVDPILDDLVDALADLRPMTPEIPYYSATMFDPRERPVCDADYWADNLRHTVRFAAAVQAAMEDGYRTFAELTPHPLLTHAVEQTAHSVDVPVAALAAMRREQPLPHGMLGLLADLYCAGAAVDFEVLYPSGHLVDAPLPTWTHRPLLLSRDGHDSPTHGGCTISVHPLLGSHVRLHEEPERHAWEGEVGTDALPWLGDHRVHNVAALPGAAYCEMALAAARTVLGEASEVRDVRFEQMLLLDQKTPLYAVATVTAPGVVNFVAQTDRDSEHERRASAVLRAVDGWERPAPHDVAALLGAHPRLVEGAEMRRWFDDRGIQYGPAFTGLTSTRTREETVSTVLAEVALPRSIRSQHDAYGVHPALLDACFQSVAVHPDVQNAAGGGLLLPLSVRLLRAYDGIRNARYCYTRVTTLDTGGVEADLDVLDENGAVLLTVSGLKLGSAMSETADRDRLLGERLLTIEWQQCTLPEADDTERGAWLLISASATADVLATKLADALKLVGGAQPTTMVWPQHADHGANAEQLGSYLAAREFRGVVVVTGPTNGTPDEHSASRGREYVQHLARIARELPDAPGEPPRFYVVTHSAQAVVAADRPNLDQAGLRGLIRVIGSEHPHLRTTQIDTDTDTDTGRLAQQLVSGSDEDETAWRNGQWCIARLSNTPLRPDERRTAIVHPEHDGLRLQIRTPGDLESVELAAFDRIPPGPGEVEVAVSASSINFADVLVAFGRYPSFEGRLPRTGTDFAGVVTAIGPGVSTHCVGDHVGGISPNGCWATFVNSDARLAVTLPRALTDKQAAAITTAYATAWYGLNDLARIGKGDRVLIHSATGGVGQAAIAIAHAAGAEIFATAGNEERRELLRDMGIEHVYDSRSIEFAEQLRSDTDGYGADIVLNSVTGAAQRAGLELLAFGGRFVEIGKRDIYGDSRLGLFPFRRNLAFYAVDLGLMSVSHPEKVHNLLDTVYRFTADGVLPLPQSRHYPLSDAATAIRVMGGAQHTGKLVLDIPRMGSTQVVVPPEQARVFRGDGAYIITGGLGGLGLFLAEKMAGAGCGRIVLTSRSQPTLKALETIELIRAIGADVVVDCGNIAESATADRLVRVATATGLPVRGVLHAAAVVEDATLVNITDELIESDWAPKVYGAWNLHTAAANQPLDWFCSFSSAAALVGSPGQGAYAAANSWLDTFTHWRRSQGLPATAIAWGAWAEIGRATALAETSDAAIAPDEGAHAFQALLSHDRAYSGYAPTTGTPWLTAFAQRSRFAEAFRASGQSRRDASEFLTELKALPPEEWVGQLRRMITEQIGRILRRSVDPDRSLSEYGVDSLGNLELRTRIETETGIRITSTDITTVRGLAELIHEKLVPQEGAPAPS